MLDAGASVEIEVFFDLTFLFTLGGFVDGEFDVAVAVADDFTHEGGIFCGDILVVEGDEEVEAHDVLIELDPFVHHAEFDVADAVIDVFQADGFSFEFAGAWDEARHEDPVVIFSFDKGVDGVPVGEDGSGADDAVFIFEGLERVSRACAALEGGGVGLFSIVDPKGEYFYAIAVEVDVSGDVMIGAERGAEDKTNFILLEDIGGAVADTGLGSGVGDQFKSEGRLIKVSGLFGVAHIELDVIGAIDGKGILRGVCFGFG